MVSEISLEQTNRIRKALGLKLIPCPDASNVTKAPQTELLIDATVERQIEQIKQRADSRKLVPPLEQKSLIDSQVTTLSWLDRMKRIEKGARAKLIPGPPISTEDQPTIPEPNSSIKAQLLPETKPKESEINSKPEKAARPRPTHHTSSVYVDPLELVEQFEPKIAHGDYNEQVKFKPRKVKSNKRRKLHANDYDISEVSPVDNITETLEASLTASRRKATAKAPTAASNIVEVNAPAEPSSSNPSALVMSNSIAFLRNIKQAIHSPTAMPSDKPTPETPVPENEVNLEQLGPVADQAATDSPPQSQPVVNIGLADTLELLRSKGVVRVDDDDYVRRRNRDWSRSVDNERLMRVQDIEEQQRHIKGRDAEAAEQKLVIKEDAKLVEEQFKDYNPVVDVVHRDSRGNVVNAKQAWRELSHKFHGTKEGKKRMEKRERSSKKSSAG